jgi:hypothetical protein
MKTAKRTRPILITFSDESDESYEISEKPTQIGKKEKTMPKVKINFDSKFQMQFQDLQIGSYFVIEKEDLPSLYKKIQECKMESKTEMERYNSIAISNSKNMGAVTIRYVYSETAVIPIKSENIEIVVNLL